jgi:hypothetical protein
VAEALFSEIRWREPTLLDSAPSAEGDTDFTEHLHAERWKSGFHQWPARWEPTATPRYRVTHIGHDLLLVIIGSGTCSSEIRNSLSVFVDNIEPGWTELSEYGWNSWELPELTTRSDDESAATVEAQLERLERCCGTEIVDAIRVEKYISKLITLRKETGLSLFPR